VKTPWKRRSIPSVGVHPQVVEEVALRLTLPSSVETPLAVETMIALPPPSMIGKDAFHDSRVVLTCVLVRITRLAVSPWPALGVEEREDRGLAPVRVLPFDLLRGEPPRGAGQLEVLGHVAGR
jgi:hypothetical protein